MIRSGRIPPNLEAVQKFNVNRVGQVEAIWYPLYDYQAYAAAGQAKLTFFALPQGQGVTSHPGSAGAKTEADTNMTAGGQLPSPQKFFCIGVSVDFWPGNAVNAGSALANAGRNWQDVWSVSRSGYLKMKIGSKDYVTDGPIGKFPSDTRLAGAAALADSTTAAAAQMTQVDYATLAGSPYEITPFWIPSSQNFAVELAWPNAMALPSGVAGRIGVRLLGYMYRLSQ